jgi:hypothetical protein
VVAVEEAHPVPSNAESMMRRNLEKTIAKLNELGVQVHGSTDGKLE